MSWQDQIGFPVLSVITFLPLVGAAILVVRFNPCVLWGVSIRLPNSAQWKFP